MVTTAQWGAFEWGAADPKSHETGDEAKPEAKAAELSARQREQKERASSYPTQ